MNWSLIIFLNLASVLASNHRLDHWNLRRYESHQILLKCVHILEGEWRQLNGLLKGQNNLGVDGLVVGVDDGASKSPKYFLELLFPQAYCKLLA